MKKSIAHIALHITRPKFLGGIFLLWLAVTLGSVGVAIIRSARENTDVLVSYARTLSVPSQNVFIEGGIMPTRVIIPALDINLPVENAQTNDIDILNDLLTRAVVRYSTSGTIGVQGENMLIFGHSSYLPIVRNQLYKAFNGIQDLVAGEVIHVLGNNGATYSYTVATVRHASATEDAVPIHVADDTSMLTLLTCDTFGKKSDRWIVTAVFDGVK